MRAFRIVTLMASAVLGESQTEHPQASAANAESRTVAEPSTAPRANGGCPVSDPFCAKLNESIAASQEHDQLQNGVEGRITGMAACSDSIYEEIKTVRDASERAHGTYLAYIEQWRKLAAKDKALFQRLTQSRSGLRAEIDKRIKDIGLELTEIDQRGRSLQVSLQQAGAEPNGREINALNALRANKRERVTNLQQTADKWTQTQRYYDGSLENARRLDVTLSELARLVESGNDLWKAYYESLEARAQYRCSSEREPVKTTLGTVRPPV